MVYYHRQPFKKTGIVWSRRTRSLEFSSIEGSVHHPPNCVEYMYYPRTALHHEGYSSGIEIEGNSCKCPTS